jgi:NIMA (never in mitosis gene a)-related kinase
MHEKRIIHRDLKPANILTFSDGLLKLSDLGLGRYMSNETFRAFSQVGTPLYMSPEVILNNGYDFKSDVWSLGCIIYELVTFKSPFRTEDKSLHNLCMQIVKGEYPKITDEKYGDFVKDLIDKMLKVNPEERIGLDDVYIIIKL